jgi:hypothetical protein
MVDTLCDDVARLISDKLKITNTMTMAFYEDEKCRCYLTRSMLDPKHHVRLYVVHWKSVRKQPENDLEEINPVYIDTPYVSEPLLLRNKRSVECALRKILCGWEESWEEDEFENGMDACVIIYYWQNMENLPRLQMGCCYSSMGEEELKVATSGMRFTHDLMHGMESTMDVIEFLLMEN